MLKQPLAYRLRKGMAENEPTELQTSRSKNTLNPRNPTSVPSGQSFRSSFASLFSFRKSRKETSKLQSLGQKGCDGHPPPVSVKGTTLQAKIHSSSPENQPVDASFVPKPAGMREGSSLTSWDTSLLEDEFFQVLDDLDSKLAQEQFPSSADTRTPLNYGSRTQSSPFYSSGNRQSSITGRHKNCYSDTSNMSIYDILRPRTPREGFKTFSPRTRTIYDMYRTREPRVLEEDYVQKSAFGSASLCFDSRERSALPATGYFTARSLHFPATTQTKCGFTPPSHKQSPKRTPLSSIIWNRPDSSRDRQNQEEFLRAPSPMEVDPADQYVYPRCFQEKRRYEFYRSQSVYPSVGLNVPMDNAMSPDPFENSENMPFYHEENSFTRPFSSNTFGRNREQRFRQSPFWGQQEEHYSWSGFHQSRKSFTSSDRDFEMISVEANSTRAGHGHRVPSQHWGSFSPSYRANISRDQEEPRAWQFDSQTSTLEGTEVSQGSRSQSAHFSTPDVCSMAGSSYHSKSGGLVSQQDCSPTEVLVNREPYSLGIAQTLAPSFRTSFPQNPDDRGDPRSPTFQNPSVTLQKIKPASLPTRSCMEVTVTNSDSADSPPVTESRPNILVTGVNNEKDLNESILQKDKQLNKMDQTDMVGEIRELVSQTVISTPFPDFQNPLSQDSAQSSRFVFNASNTVSSKRLPGVVSRRDGSKSHKANELKKEKSYTGDRKFASTISLPFIQDSRPSAFPSPDQGCHQELSVSDDDISSIIKNNHWSTDNQNAESPGKPAISDTKEEQCVTAYSANCSKSADHNMPRASSDLSSGTVPDSSPSNDSRLGALVIPSTTVFSRKFPSGKAPSLGEREEKENDCKNQNSQFSLSLSENPKSNDNRVPVDGVVDVVKGHSHLLCGDGKGKGKVRRHISYIEKLSKTESCSTPTSDRHRLEENQSHSKAPELHTVYCTLPRKSAGFLINSRKSESELAASSCRSEPLPFQTNQIVEDPAGKCTPNKFSPGSCESESKCCEIVSDSVSVAPEASEGTTGATNTGSASVRKGPLPVIIKRAASCPSGVPYPSAGREERGDTDASAITQRPWERLIRPLGSDSAVLGGSSSKRHHQKEYFQEGTEKNGKIAASRTGMFSHPNERPFPVSSDVSGKEGGKTLHKLKTTSVLSVSGDEDNVKCLEVVSIYYTLPRKHSKTFCNLLQKYTQSIESLTESTKVGTETSPKALEKDKLNYSTQEQPGTPSSKDLKMPVSSAQENSHCLSRTTEDMTASHSPSIGPSQPTLQAVASTEADASLHKEESQTREISPHNVAKTPPCDPQSKTEKGKKLQSETLRTSSMLQGENVTEEKSENCQLSIKSGNSGLSNLPAHSEEDVENSQILRRPGGCAGRGLAFTATGSLQKDVTGMAEGDGANGLQPWEAKGEIRTDFPKKPDKPLSGPESQASALTLALYELQLDEEACSGEQDLDSLQSEPRALTQQSQEVSMTEIKAEDELQILAWDQPSLPGGSNKNKTSLGDLEKGKNRSSAKHRLAAMSKASRKCPAKDLSPRRHVATIFPQSGNSSGFSTSPECHSLSPEPTLKSTESTDAHRLSNDGMTVEESENRPQVTISNREAATHLKNQKSNSILQPHHNELKNISELQAKCHENSNDITTAQILERESGALAQPTWISLREADFPDHQRRLNPPLQLGPIENSTVSIPLASCLQQQRSASSLEWEPEPQPYRSKSLKSINVHGDLLRKSHPPKVRGRHFSESVSIDNALSRLTLGGEFSSDNGYSRRFKSFSELPSSEEDERWALYSDRTKMGPRSATSISRPIDYGIFGKEQQLAFLENVKRSLTQGRLWKPSFLKNPGFLKDDIINPPNPTVPASSNSPSNQMPQEGLSPSAPLNIYEEDPVDSDCDTDTTTDDEYYLDENDKESEL